MQTEDSSVQEGQFHCVRCNAVFSAPLSMGRPQICSICGNSPQRNATYASVANITSAVDVDSCHGVPGKDMADFVSMKMVRRKRQMKWAIVAWCSLLVIVVGITVYSQNKEVPIVVEDAAKSKELLKLRKKRAAVYQECLGVYNEFIRSDGSNERSQFVVGGVSQLLKMQEYYDTTVDPSLVGNLNGTGLGYYEEGSAPRLEAILEDSQKRQFELIFWETEKGWKLDWEHHVRYQEANWTEFLLAPKVGASQSFKLYVRKRYSSDEGGDLNLIFYQPSIIAGERNQESPQVKVSVGHQAYEKLKQAFEDLERGEKVTGGKVVGKLDPTGLLRVKASLVFDQNEQERPQLELEDVEAFHWMALEPEVD